MRNRFLLAVVFAVVWMLGGCSTNTAPVETQDTTAEVPPGTESEISETEPITQSPMDPPSLPSDEKTGGVTIMVAADLHYLARDLTDLQNSFQSMSDHGDGKVMEYIWEITDAFVAKAIEENPDLVILAGDLTLEGEKKSHIALTGKLKKIEQAGISVIVIPGNHDINNPRASQFYQDSVETAESISPEEFEDIYQDFGYMEAVSRDPYSLSYVYQINDYTRAMMLDTCQYEPGNKVGGMIKDDTYDWIEEQMEEAWKLGMNVIPVGHHNLLDQSEVYLKDCTIEHSEQLIDQLESWDVPLFLSGHLHVQHFMRSQEDFGIYEIVTSSLSTPPCQYGILHYKDDGSFQYHTESVDIEDWAKQAGETDKNLLKFESFGKKKLSRVFYNQAMDEFENQKSLENITKYQRDQMAMVYAELNTAYYEGDVVTVREKIMKSSGYKMWGEEGYPSILSQYLEWITRDGTKNYNILESN